MGGGGGGGESGRGGGGGGGLGNMRSNLPAPVQLFQGGAEHQRTAGEHHQHHFEHRLFVNTHRPSGAGSDGRRSGESPPPLTKRSHRARRHINPQPPKFCFVCSSHEKRTRALGLYRSNTFALCSSPHTTPLPFSTCYQHNGDDGDERKKIPPTDASIFFMFCSHFFSPSPLSSLSSCLSQAATARRARSPRLGCCPTRRAASRTTRRTATPATTGAGAGAGAGGSSSSSTTTGGAARAVTAVTAAAAAAGNTRTSTRGGAEQVRIHL
jgi:hypothetical protein